MSSHLLWIILDYGDSGTSEIEDVSVDVVVALGEVFDKGQGSVLGKHLKIDLEQRFDGGLAYRIHDEAIEQTPTVCFVCWDQTSMPEIWRAALKHQSTIIGAGETLPPITQSLRPKAPWIAICEPLEIEGGDLNSTVFELGSAFALLARYGDKECKVCRSVRARLQGSPSPWAASLS